MTNFEKHKKKILDVMTNPQNENRYPAVTGGESQLCDMLCEVCEIADPEIHCDAGFIFWALKEEGNTK